MVMIGKSMKNEGLVEFENRKTKEKVFMPADKIVGFLENLAREHTQKVGGPLPAGITA